MKCNQSRPGFELVSPCSFPTAITTTPRVAQGGTATSSATKQLLPPDRVLRELYIYIYIYHHHHHVVPLARISLTLSWHFSLSFIASGWSSGLHPVSSHSCCMYVRAGRRAFAWPYVGVHKSTSIHNLFSLFISYQKMCSHTHTHTHTHIYIYIYIYILVKNNYRGWIE